jgi:hypothetical protein
MKRTAISVAVLSLAVAGVSQAQAAPSAQKVTGGGQVLSAGQTQGAGSTIAFNAQGPGDGSPAKGQIQYVGRGDNAGDKFHASNITCFLVMGNTATIVGEDRTGKAFRLDLVDNGEGAGADSYMILIDRVLTANDPGTEENENESDCSQSDDDEVPDLARGNVQVHKAKA